jgi:hypothetical protein
MIKKVKSIVKRFKKWYAKVTCKHDGRIVKYFPRNIVTWENGESCSSLKV